MIYRFGDCELDTTLYELRRAGTVRPLDPKAFDLLCHLIRHRDRVVTRSELYDALWDGRIVAEATVASHLKAVRQAIGDDGRTQGTIRTLHRRGFRFVAPLAAAPPESPESAAAGQGQDRGSDDTPGAAAPPTSEAAAVPAPPGRAALLDRLARLFAAAAAGRRQIVFLTGEAGIGKTTLVEAFLARLRAAAPGLRVALGRCVEGLGPGDPYLPVLDALGRLVRGPDGAALVRLLEAAAPAWLQQLPWAADPAAAEALHLRALGATPGRMLRELAAVLEEAAAAAPLVLVLEDLHWSDGATLEGLRFLAARQEPARLMLLATCRSDGGRSGDSRDDGSAGEAAAHRLAATLALRSQAEVLPLPPLGRAAVADWLAARLPGRRLPPELAALLCRRSDGNPLFAEILLAGWLADGRLPAPDNDAAVAASLAALAATVPAALDTLIADRLHALAAEDRALLEAAALAGTVFEAAAVAAALERPAAAVEARCEALCRGPRLLSASGAAAWADGTVAGRYAFVHELWRDAIAARVSPGRRTALHARLGHRLEQGLGPGAAGRALELAGHFAAARDAARAVRHLAAAAAQAAARGAPAEQLRLLERARALLPGIADPAARRIWEADLEAARAPALIAAEGWASVRAETAYRAALAAAEAAGDWPRAGAALHGLATLCELRGRYRDTEALLQRRRTLPGIEADPSAAVAAAELLACSTFHQGRFADALAHANAGLAGYEPRRDAGLGAAVGEDAGPACHAWAARALFFLGHPAAALAQSRRALAAARAAPHAFARAAAHEQAACLFQHCGEPGPVRRHAAAVIRLAQAYGQPYRVATGRILEAWARVMPESVPPDPAAAAMAESALDACRTLGATIDLPYFLALAADIHRRLGHRETAADRLAEALERARAAEGFFYEAELHRLAGTLRGDDAAAAEADFTAALAAARRQGALLLELRAANALARLALAQGRPAAAAALLGPLVTRATARLDGGAPFADLAEARTLLAAAG